MDGDSLTLTDVQLFLRVDTDDDIIYLQLLMDVAKEYVTAAVGTCDESKARVRLLELMIISNLYEKRLYTIESASEKVQYALHSMVMQLQLEEVDANVDDSESGQA